jgi:hypothetical protein
MIAAWQWGPVPGAVPVASLSAPLAARPSSCNPELKRTTELNLSWSTLPVRTVRREHQLDQGSAVSSGLRDIVRFINARFSVRPWICRGSFTTSINNHHDHWQAAYHVGKRVSEWRSKRYSTGWHMCCNPPPPSPTHCSLPVSGANDHCRQPRMPCTGRVYASSFAICLSDTRA